MRGKFPEIVLVRHGETAWSVSGQHTGRTDIPLTLNGEAAARKLAARLAGDTYAAEWSSPAQRARRTAELAGFGTAQIKPDLAEWDYGAYEGRTSHDIHAERPDWKLFRDGCPDGEHASDVGTRVDRIIAEARALGEDLLIFSSSHAMRVLAARWIGLPPEAGAYFVLGTTGVSALTYEHGLDEPVIRTWNS